jgi:hypothetical protein
MLPSHATSCSPYSPLRFFPGFFSKTSQPTAHSTPPTEMPPPFSSFLQDSDDYEFEYVTAIKDDDECFMCKEPYTQSGRANDDSCFAVHLKSCGHIIGYECFSTWIKGHPGMCPCWNHTLPLRRKRWKIWPSDLISRICRCVSFRAPESFVHQKRHSDETFALALYALQAGRLTLVQACYLWICYVVIMVFYVATTYVVAAIWIAAMAHSIELLCTHLIDIPCTGLGCRVLLCEEWISECLGFHYLVFAVTFWTLVLSTILIMIVSSVLAIGLWKNFTRKRRNMWVRVVRQPHT